MVEAPTIFLQLLLLMILIAIVGEPFRIVISRFTGLFNDVDILQASVLDVYLGGFVLYALALVPLHLFSSTVTLGITIVFGLFSVFFHRRRIRKAMETVKRDRAFITLYRNYLSTHGKTLLEYGIIVALFLGGLWIQVVPLQNFMFGSIQDTSLHALFTQVIIENKNIPLTMQPYLSEGIVYPQGAHVIYAYACYILGYSPPQTIFYLTALFQALVILGTYYLGKALHSRLMGISFAFIFLVVSRWPQLITWGVQPYIAGFAFQFICFSLISMIMNGKLQVKGGQKALELLVIGLLLGYLAALHFTLYVIVMASAAVLVLVQILRKRVFSGLRQFLISFGVSLIPISLFIGRVLIWWGYPGHNIGLPSDVAISPWPAVNAFSWILFYQGISPYPIIVFLVIVLFTISLASIYRMRRQLAQTTSAVELALSSMVASVALYFLFNLQFVFPFLSMIFGETARPTISFLISLYFCVGIFNVSLYNRIKQGFAKKIGAVLRPNKAVLMKATAIVLTLSILLLIYSPFLYYLTKNDQFISETYAMRSVTTHDDYELMLWMRDNLPKNAIILANVYESGTFIPSISHLKALYPFVASKDSASFQSLSNLMTQGTLNANAYDVMKQLGINYVYVGARALHLSERNYNWDAQVFLSNPNFNLTKRIGDAYLFEVLYGKPNVFLEDNFDYANISDGGWKYSFDVGSPNNGSGSATLVSRDGSMDQRSLVLTAEKDAGVFFENRICRNVYAYNTSNVVLSFALNASVGYHPPDGINIYVSDTSWHQFIRFATPGQLYGENESVVPIASVGSFNVNISAIWRQFHNSTLPNPFSLIVSNIDFDGVENVAFIDSISIGVGD